MPKYRVRMTRTQTDIFTIETTVDIPTDNPVKAQAYAEVAIGFGIHDPRSPLRYQTWRGGDRSETTACEVLNTDPDFEEVPAAPASEKIDF